MSFNPLWKDGVPASAFKDVEMSEFSGMAAVENPLFANTGGDEATPQPRGSIAVQSSC